MAKSKKRGRDYYLNRLKAEYPRIYEDYSKGKFRSVRAAAIAAGLTHDPGPLDIMKRGWRRATKSQRLVFYAWAKADLESPSGTGKPPLQLGPDGKLTAVSVKLVFDLMKKDGVKAGAVMKAMGYKALNPVLGMVLARRQVPKPEFLRRLNTWVNSRR